MIGMMFVTYRLFALVTSPMSLVGCIPKSIGTLSYLQELDLSYNRLLGTIPDSICSLENLVALKLSGNSLTGIVRKISASYSFETISNPTTIISTIFLVHQTIHLFVYLSGCIPEAMGRLRHLRELMLDYNRLTGAAHSPATPHCVSHIV